MQTRLGGEGSFGPFGSVYKVYTLLIDRRINLYYYLYIETGDASCTHALNLNLLSVFWQDEGAFITSAITRVRIVPSTRRS